LTTISIAPAHVDLATGETAATGNLRLIAVSGVGVVYATAGRYVIVSATGDVLDFSGLDVPPVRGTVRLTAAIGPALRHRFCDKALPP
jgi:hypothetical protein